MASERAGSSRRWVGRHPLAFIGTVLCLAALTQLLFALGIDLFTGISNSYTGLLLYAILPGLFLFGLLCIFLGGWLYRRSHKAHVRWVVDWGEPRDRASALGVIVLVLVSASALAGATHRTLTYMSSTEFCSEVCHEVMAPQSATHRLSAHSRIACTECHVAPGVSGFIQAKLGGMSQVWHTMKGDLPRPITIPNMAAVPEPGVCARCHDANRAFGTVARTYTTYAPDEKNSRSDTTLQMYIGSPRSGIHRHLSLDIRFLSNDGGRTIQRARMVQPGGRQAEYTAPPPPEGGAAPSGAHGAGKSVWRSMTCIDCHNRVGHDVLSFEARVDHALAVRELPASVPGLKKRVMEASAAPEALPTRERYQETRRQLEELARSHPKLRQANAGATLNRLYTASVFPPMKVEPATYPRYLGHEGCFRCHGVLEPVAPLKTAPSNTCNLCHSQP